MHYVIGDIHSEVKKLNSILEQISPGHDDEVYFSLTQRKRLKMDSCVYFIMYS